MQICRQFFLRQNLSTPSPRNFCRKKNSARAIHVFVYTRSQNSFVFFSVQIRIALALFFLRQNLSTPSRRYFFCRKKNSARAIHVFVYTGNHNCLVLISVQIAIAPALFLLRQALSPLSRPYFFAVKRIALGRFMFFLCTQTSSCTAR